eukprot:SAG22_NODE_250_length_13779_cov_6.413450_4_plen_169_part_00
MPDDVPTGKHEVATALLLPALRESANLRGDRVPHPAPTAPGMPASGDGDHLLSPAQLAQFDADGFIILRGAFSASQMAALSSVARADPVVSEAAATSAKQIKLWDETTDDIYSAFALQQKIVGPIAQLIGPIEHYHHKLIMKEKAPLELTTGTWEWVRACRAAPGSLR